MKHILCIGLLAIGWPALTRAQKRPLDHTVYDSWQSLGEKLISSDGKTVVYAVTPQEGDAVLIVQHLQPADLSAKVEIPRGYKAVITPDGRFVIGKIKALFKDTREARIKKKKPDEMPKDSLFILDLNGDKLMKVANIKSYKTPEAASGWVAYLAEKPSPDAGGSNGRRPAPDSLALLNNLSRMADSLTLVADSLRKKAEEARTKGIAVLRTETKRRGPAGDPIEEGALLTLRNLYTGEELQYPRVKEYIISKKGDALVIDVTRKKDDSLSKAYIGWVKIGMLAKGPVPPNPSALSEIGVDIVIKGYNEVKNLALDDAAGQLAFVLERDSSAKALRKFYSAYYYKPGMAAASLIIDRHTPGVLPEWTVSENYELNFSKSGARLFVGLAPIRPVKDTTVPDFEKAGLDIWHYKDDNLQPVQLKSLDRELKRSWLAGWDVASQKLAVYGSQDYPLVMVTREGDGEAFYTSSDSGKRVEQQWQGFTLKDVYAVNPATGAKRLVVRDLKGEVYPSYTGRFLLYYDEPKKSYFLYNNATGAVASVAKDIREPVYDVENDVPDDPNPYGIAGWEKDDRHVYVYGRYGIWAVDPEGKPSARVAPGDGKVTMRYIRVEDEEKFIDPAKPVYIRLFDEESKKSWYARMSLGNPASGVKLGDEGAWSVNGLQKADSSNGIIFTRESFSTSPNLYSLDGATAVQLSNINRQQASYNWGTAELVKWKSYTGRMTEGLLYKPEDFDAKKKYPLIVYYYERNANTLYSYQAPSPTPSRLNIPFFVSRGYLVFVPDIWYTTGHPGKSAYDYVMSGVRSLISKGFVDSTKMGLQGQSWGGYQTAYIITKTNLFSAAWAGAPVVDMFSAYGGIRWESGVNRQMQYEKTQSRIGATIWQRPDLYIENSPLFHLQQVKTPLVIMSNDADGAVPWYQGIEFFTAMRRLHKPIWLLEYNGEAHNLVERRNRKDIQIREQQFFDWLLKGDKAPKWITTGIPATLKGIDYGIGIE